MLRAFFFLVFSTAMLCVPVALKRITCGFRLAKLRLEIPFRSEWETPPPEREQCSAILNQPFTYLDRGAQCYVFLSADRQYVLKFFRYDQPINPLRSLFRFWFCSPKPKTPFKKKIEQFFSSCTIAYHLRREETGLIYLHLNRTENLLPKVKIRAPLGQVYEISLDHYRFAIQKKVETIREAFARVKDRQEAKELIYSLIELVQRRKEKGIANLDLNISRNYGFIDGKAVEIDFGSFATSSKEEEFLHRLSQFLTSVAPEWVSLLNENL